MGIDYRLIDSIVNFCANVFTVFASGIAIYLFVCKREKIKSVIQILFNYSTQISISEVKYKLERLNDYTVSDPEQKDIIINILNDISGQIKGNKNIFNSDFVELLNLIDKYTHNQSDFSEPKKRSLVSELREKLRHVDIQNNS
jgi:hypothetical protein